MSMCPTAWHKCTDVTTTWSEGADFLYSCRSWSKVIPYSYFSKLAEGEDCSDGRQRGRPSIEVVSDEVEVLLSKGFSKSKVAEMLGVSPQSLYNKLSSLGQAHFQKYADISDNDLHLKLRSIKSTHPNDGEVIPAGHLLSQGIRVQWEKLRASIHRVDPTGTAERSVAVRKRVYHVDAANDVWHSVVHEVTKEKCLAIPSSSEAMVVNIIKSSIQHVLGLVEMETLVCVVIPLFTGWASRWCNQFCCLQSPKSEGTDN